MDLVILVSKLVNIARQAIVSLSIDKKDVFLLSYDNFSWKTKPESMFDV